MKGDDVEHDLAWAAIYAALPAAVRGYLPPEAAEAARRSRRRGFKVVASVRADLAGIEDVDVSAHGRRQSRWHCRAIRKLANRLIEEEKVFRVLFEEGA